MKISALVLIAAFSFLASARSIHDRKTDLQSPKSVFIRRLECVVERAYGNNNADFKKCMEDIDKRQLKSERRFIRYRTYSTSNDNGGHSTDGGFNTGSPPSTTGQPWTEMRNSQTNDRGHSNDHNTDGAPLTTGNPLGMHETSQANSSRGKHSGGFHMGNPPSPTSQPLSEMRQTNDRGHTNNNHHNTGEAPLTTGNPLDFNWMSESSQAKSGYSTPPPTFNYPNKRTLEEEIMKLLKLIK